MRRKMIALAVLALLSCETYNTLHVEYEHECVILSDVTVSDSSLLCAIVE